MKEFWDTIELKGIPIWKALQILNSYGWRIVVLNPADEAYNRMLKENNRKAIEQALIELNYTV